MPKFEILANLNSNPYPKCVAYYLENLSGGPGGWFQWVLSGSYYIREGTQGM